MNAWSQVAVNPSTISHYYDQEFSGSVLVFLVKRVKGVYSWFTESHSYKIT